MSAKNTNANAVSVDADEAKVPHQTGETKVTVGESDGKTVVVISDQKESAGVVSKLKGLVKNRKVVIGAAAFVLTVAAGLIIKNQNSKNVEDETPDETASA